MDAEGIYFRLLAAGVSVDVEDGRLVAWPSDRVPPSLAVPLRQHASELVRRLEGRPSAGRRLAEAQPGGEPHPAPNPHLTGRWARWGDLIRCPHCRARDLVEVAGGLHCRACGRLAWLEGPRSITRADCQDEGLRAVSCPAGPSAPELHRRLYADEEARIDRRRQERLREAQAATTRELF